jgi:cephalosporin hydroxylase
MIEIDMDKGEVSVTKDGETVRYAMDTPEAFQVVSRAWLRAGWDNKYVYGFSWLGRPIIQLPEDMFRLQEVIYALRPDVIVETGVAHGGSLIFYATLCKAMAQGRVIGIDIEIRPHNRRAIEDHELAPLITLIEGSSVDLEVIDAVRALIMPGEKVIVLLDSNHTKDHVLGELKAYAPMVTEGSYLVAMDGIMGDLGNAPRTQDDWSWNNPYQAAIKFVDSNLDFAFEEPTFPFNEGNVQDRVTYWPSAFIKRLR